MDNSWPEKKSSNWAEDFLCNFIKVSLWREAYTGWQTLILLIIQRSWVFVHWWRIIFFLQFLCKNVEQKGEFQKEKLTPCQKHIDCIEPFCHPSSLWEYWWLWAVVQDSVLRSLYGIKKGSLTNGAAAFMNNAPSPLYLFYYRRGIV